MKNFTGNAFLKVCSGVAMVTLSVAALFLSVKKAEAAPMSNFKPVGASGKYAFDYTVSQAQNGNYYWQITIMNTETGMFKSYYWDNSKEDWNDNFGKQVPALP